jgi:hypothetical protein
MATEKPLDLPVVQAWLAAWNESDVFSDAAVLHLQSLIADVHCLVVITLGVGREPRSLVFRRLKRVLEADHGPSVSSSPTIVWDSISTSAPTFASAKGASSSPTIRWDRWPHTNSLSLARSVFASPVAPVAPSVDKLWHQTGVKSKRVPKLERVLRWDGAEWVIAGYVFDSPIIMKHGKQECDLQEALVYARVHTERWDCEFIYTYYGPTWGNA